jgi:hypothetical protein
MVGIDENVALMHEAVTEAGPLLALQCAIACAQASGETGVGSAAY